MTKVPVIGQVLVACALFILSIVAPTPAFAGGDCDDTDCEDVSPPTAEQSDFEEAPPEKVAEQSGHEEAEPNVFVLISKIERNLQRIRANSDNIAELEINLEKVQDEVDKLKPRVLKLEEYRISHQTKITELYTLAITLRTDLEARLVELEEARIANEKRIAALEAAAKANKAADALDRARGKKLKGRVDELANDYNLSSVFMGGGMTIGEKIYGVNAMINSTVRLGAAWGWGDGDNGHLFLVTVSGSDRQIGVALEMANYLTLHGDSKFFNNSSIGYYAGGGVDLYGLHSGLKYTGADITARGGLWFQKPLITSDDGTSQLSLVLKVGPRTGYGGDSRSGAFGVDAEGNLGLHWEMRSKRP